MHRYTRIAAGSIFAGSLLFTGGVAPANAAPVVTGGVVNVTVPVEISGNTVLTDFLNENDVDINAAIPVNVAAELAVLACDLVDVNVNQVSVLARSIGLQRNGGERTICTSEQGDVTISNDLTQTTS